MIVPGADTELSLMAQRAVIVRRILACRNPELYLALLREREALDRRIAMVRNNRRGACHAAT